MELKTGNFTPIHLTTTNSLNLPEGATWVLNLLPDYNVSDFWRSNVSVLTGTQG
jgi:hypothetical protein